MNNNIKSLEKVKKVNEAQIYNRDDVGSYGVTITRYVTDVDGTIQNKSVLPAFMQTNYPVFLFGAFDYQGAYNIGNQIMPFDRPGIFYIFSGIYSKYFDILSFSGANNIKDQLTIGDYICMFSDSKQFPTWFVWIIISSKPRAYGSVLQNPIDKGMKLTYGKMFVDYFQQYNELIYMPKFNEVGDYSHDQFVPLQYVTPDYQTLNYVRIPFNFLLTNWNALYFYMNFNSNEISFEFRYDKSNLKF